MEKYLGRIAFVIGLLISILAAFLNIPYLSLILAVVGLFVGLLNISGSEAGRFLMSSMALMITGTSGLAVLPGIGGLIAAIAKNLIFFIGAATIIVAFRTMFAVSKN